MAQRSRRIAGWRLRVLSFVLSRPLGKSMRRALAHALIEKPIEAIDVAQLPPSHAPRSWRKP